MTHYNYQQTLHKVWEQAVAYYRQGVRSADQIVAPQGREFLASIGQTPQEFYDYAEDYVDGGEPDFATVAMVADIRRSFFRDKQKQQPTGRSIDPDSLPAKDSEAAGITWLPRIIEKAKAKLHGELDPDTMYGCGGDRHFLRENDIHPAEFLRQVRDNLGNDQAVIDWVAARSPQKAG